ncbi:SAM-dependent methyltransferase [Saccharopolyspora sp. 5N708]|uniref:SAM-dependent methyltransferase n=1 Tax=Saccharopolyspora sp. 5N708 TaxID=3457424 RepID=UPI003FD444A5
MTSLNALRRPDRYPRSAAYDPQWVVDNCMGPNPLWLLEDLGRDCVLRPGMKVLDLGCGLGMTSIFLAREYDVEVWAADLWIAPEDNRTRFRTAGVADRAHPVAADARELPFDEGKFDAIVGVGSYHYFGTDDLYIGYITKFLAPGGQLAVAVPSVRRELRDVGGIPDHLRTGIGWEVLSFHTPNWWRFHWEQTHLVEVTAARMQHEGWADWKLWCEVCAEHSSDETVRRGSVRDLRMLDADRGEHLTFALITARAPA